MSNSEVPAPVPNPEVVKLRLHPVAAAVNGLRVLRQILPIIVIMLFTGTGETGPLLYLIIFGLPATVFGIGRWLMFRYWVEDGELRVEQGLLVRKKIFLPIDHVQAVDITSGILQRIFGLVRVQVKSAAAGNQADLSAVTRAEAQRLQTILKPADRPAPAPDSAAAPPPPAWKMSQGQLLLAASTSGQIGVILSGVAWVYSQVDEAVHKRVVEFLESMPAIESVQTTNPVFIGGLIVAGLLLTWALSVGGAIVRYGGFTVERRGDRLVVSRGLLERRETSIPVDRIQAVRIAESALRQPFGYATIYVESAGHADERGRSTWIHPFLHKREWSRFLQELAPEFDVQPRLERPPLRVLHRFLIWPAIVSLFIAVPLTLFVPYGWLGFLILPVVLGVGVLTWRDTGLGFSADGRVAVLRDRKLERITAVVPRRRVQFAATSTSLFQRRRGVGSATLGAASGNEGKRFTARDLDEGTCAGLLAWAHGEGPPTGELASP